MAKYKRFFGIEISRSSGRFVATINSLPGSGADAATEIKALNRLAIQQQIPTFEQWRLENNL